MIEFGISIFFNDVQFENEPAPILLIIDVLNVNIFKDVHLSNIYSPIDKTVDGNVIDSNDLHPLNA